MLVEELEELLLKLLSGATLSKGEVLVVCELAEVFGQNILKVVKHLVQG